MPSWPDNWVGQALSALNVPVNSDTIAIMRTWKDSTPLPPYTNNPIGMPAHVSGATEYLKTGYGMFLTMGKFYAALRSFAMTPAGKTLIEGMHSDSPYPATWRNISALGWPGSKTETDYPSKLLDLTSASYQASVNATPAASRKSSGTVLAPSDAKAQVIANAHAVVRAAQAFTDGHAAVESLYRKK